MTPTEYRDHIARLGLSQVRAGRLLGRDARTSRRWALGQSNIPPEAAIILRLLVAGKLTIAQVEAARDAGRDKL